MARRVRKDVIDSRQLASSQRQHLRYGSVKIVDHHIEVELLRLLGVGPSRRSMVGRRLKGKTGGRVGRRDHDPVRAGVGHRQAEEFGVERGQRRGIRAVDDHVVGAADHHPILRLAS